MGTDTAVSTPSAATARRRRWPWVLATVIGAVILIGLFAAGWYVSGLLGDSMRSDHSPAEPDLTIESVSDSTVSYRYDDGYDGWIDQGLMALSTEQGGWTQTAEPEASGATGERLVGEEQSGPPLRSGQRARFDGDYFYRDPKAGLGLDFSEVGIQTPLGPAPAWSVPGKRDTWIVFIHGRNGSREESLRVMSAAARGGYPMLVITYRNDEGAPPGNGYVHFGADEWEDLEAAAQYALDQGAQDLVLAGYSMGGGIALSFMANSPLADRVVGMFLDTPIASVPQQIAIEAEEMGVPGFVTDLGKWIAELRFGADYGATDYTSQASKFDVPTTVVQGMADETVNPRITRTYADAVNAAHPGTVQYEEFADAEHVGSWNVDPPRYDGLVEQLLERAAG